MVNLPPLWKKSELQTSTHLADLPSSSFCCASWQPLTKWVMGVKQCHKPAIWEWFIPAIYGEVGDGL